MALSSVEEAQLRDLLTEKSALDSLAASEAIIISKLGATKKNLGELASASSLGDTDLLFVRQGTTDKSITGLVVKTGLTTADASTTVKGIVELATNAETVTGTDTVRAVTPANLQAKVASETAKGIVELATDAETITGTDTVRAVTPANLQAKVTSTTVKGIVQLATNAEAQALADALKAITPSTLASAFQGANQSIGASGYQKLPGGLIIQWGTATTAGGGMVIVTFPIAFPNAARSVTLGLVSSSPVNAYQAFTGLTISGMRIYTNAAGGGIQLGTVNYIVIGN